MLQPFHKEAIPVEVLVVARELILKGHQAYLVGGCVRDLILGRSIKDWDITTNATPEKILEIFPDSVYENEFGTVGVKTDSGNAITEIVEVTTFRKEGRYTDKRHPDEVVFTTALEDDLSRRDFTVNAMALEVTKDGLGELVDVFEGQVDLTARVMRTVGKAEDRFEEDALRLMRGVRLATELDFQIDMETRRAIEKKAGLLEMISKERIRDEFQKMMMTERAAAGVILLEELDLLRYVLPELREGLGVGQNKHHIYTVFEHNVRALDYSAREGYSLTVRLASLLHDVGKPKTKRGEGPDCTFYNHDIVGAKMTVAILERLKFSKKIITDVAHLVRFHMFYYNVGEVSDAGVRRFLNRVGPETVPDLIKLREADRIGSGVPKAVPYKLRHFLFMIEKVKMDPVSPKMLKINGEDVMRILSLKPGPKVGFILNILLEEVLDDPKRNMSEYLEKRAVELNKEDEKQLSEIARKAKEKKEEFESGVEEEMKKKYYVK
ncbi:MAG: HDIG domain-containing protein [Anaplasmataceae bacterium]|nr:HDIG domain-containing protein [Anaplasmataceae bacterium]